MVVIPSEKVPVLVVLDPTDELKVVALLNESLVVPAPGLLEYREEEAAISSSPGAVSVAPFVTTMVAPVPALDPT